MVVTLAVFALMGAPVAAQAPASAAPPPAAALPKLEKLTVSQCKFMLEHALGMDKELKHFSAAFKRSLGDFATRAVNCSGKPVIAVMTPEDDRGVVVLWKLMYGNKQGNLFDSIYIFDPNGIADVSRSFRPNQVLRVLPPELGS